jgi:hypothetical protein
MLIHLIHFGMEKKPTEPKTKLGKNGYLSKQCYNQPHMRTMLLVYLPTKLGVFWGKCW